MIRIIILFTLFFFLANTTVAHPRTAAIPNTKITAKKPKPPSWKTTNLQKFIESLNEKCDFDLLNAVYKDLKDLWTIVIKEGNEHTSMEMDNVKGFLKKILELYNKCIENDHFEFDGEWELYLKIFGVIELSGRAASPTVNAKCMALQADTFPLAFQDFKIDAKLPGKEYNAKEKEMRKEIFKKSKEEVKKHNELYKKGAVAYSASLNHLSDWTEEELEKMNGFRPFNATLHSHSKRKARFVEGLLWRNYYYNPYNSVPISVDWRTKGNYVGPVKVQGSCGSCYAMAALGALEAYHKKKTGVFVLLSTQNILDCTWYLDNKGCEEGYAFTIFQYAYSPGVVSNFRYPYTMNASHNCRWRRQDVVATDRGYYIVEEDNELALRNAVADYGPVAVSVGTNHLRNYRSGVFSITNCGKPNHIALVVGYGTDPVEGDYWIVKNSWGFWWGEDGYFRLSRNNGNKCHIASYAYFPY